MNSKFYKGLTLCIAGFGIIIGLLMAYEYKTIVALISVWTGTAFLCFIFGGIAKILLYLEKLCITGKEADNELKEQRADWKCPVCSQINKGNDRVCVKCHWKRLTKG